MDSAVREAAALERRRLQSRYEKEGYVGEGAFGVVVKARVKQNTETEEEEEQTAAAEPMTAVGHPTAAGDRQANGVSAAAASASASSAAASSSSAVATAAPSASSSSAPPVYVALKQMLNHREGQGIPQDAYREIKLLRELRHPHLIRLDRVFTRPSAGEIDLIYEYAEHDLAEILKSNRARTQAHTPKALVGQPAGMRGVSDVRFVKSVMWQLLSGVAYMHSQYCMHRDLKPSNILVVGLGDDAAHPNPEAGRVKLGDFGLARLFQSPLRKLSDDGEVVTIWYRAPELLLGCKHYTRAIDMFALGAIFFELLTCAPLFPGVEVKAPAPGAASHGTKVFQEHQMREVCRVLGKPTTAQWPELESAPHFSLIKSWPSKDYPYTLPERLPSYATAHARSLMEGLLHYDPAKRTTAEEALNHPYFKEEPRPHANVFVGVDGNLLRYPVRPTKPLSALTNKRARGEQGKKNNAPAGTQGAAAAANASAAAPPAAQAPSVPSAGAAASSSSQLPPSGRPPSASPPSAAAPSLNLTSAQHARLSALSRSQAASSAMQEWTADSQQPPQKLQRHR